MNHKKIQSIVFIVLITLSTFAFLLKVDPAAASPPNYSVTFTESGLAPGTSWNITFNGNVQTSTTNTITVAVPNGDYPYTINTPSGYTLGSPSQATLTVADANVNKPVTFASSDSSSWSMFQHDLLHTGQANINGPLTNHTLWTATLSSIGSSSAAVVDGVVYVGSENNSVYALNAADGTLIWNHPTDGSVGSSPAVVDNVVYIGSDDGDVYALHAENGSVIWSYSFGITMIFTSPTVANGILYMGASNTLFALNATDGSLIWQKDTSDMMMSSAAVVDGVVYVGGYDRYVYALNASTGAEIWNYYTWSHLVSSPTVVNGVVYIGCNNNNVYALNATATSDQHIWDHALGGMVESSPAYYNGVVYVGSDNGMLYALNATSGSEIWSSDTGGMVQSSPAVANGVVYVGSYGNSIYAYNATDGSQIWKYTTGDQVVSSPAIVNGVVYMGSRDGKMYAFSTSQYTLTMNTVGQGTVNPGNQTYNEGSVVNLEAIPAAGWSFSGWSGDSTGTTNTTLTMDSNKTVTATFTQDSYTLTMITNGQGTVQPGNQTYLSGSVVDLKAINANGWTFSGWTGDASGDSNTTITMTQNMVITAVFAQNSYSLTIVAVGQGTVNPGNHTYLSGTSVDLEAINAAGWSFGGWSGDASGTTNTTIIMDANKTVTAIFTRNAYLVNFTLSGVGSDVSDITLTVDGVTYTADTMPSFVWEVGSQHSYSFSSTLSVNSGKRYVWSSTDGLLSLQSGSLTVNESGVITGTFKTQYLLAVTSSHGTTTGSGWYDAGTSARGEISSMTVMSGNSTRYVFKGWSGDAQDSSAYVYLTMDKQKTITANWETQYNIVFTANPTNSGSTSSLSTWAKAGQLAITATPNAGYKFASWTATGAITVASTQSNSTTATISGPGTITANFEAAQTNTVVATVTTNHQNFNVTVDGTIKSSQMSQISITPDRRSRMTIVAFNVTGPSGTEGFANMTIAKSAIPYGTTPIVMIDGVPARVQGYTDDANNYYVWYSTHFSTHQITIEFKATTTEPQPTTNAFEVPVVAAVILIGLVLAGLFLRQKKKSKA